MDEILKDVTSIFVLMVGVATIAVLVQNAQGTAAVVGSVASGYAQDITASMGQGAGNNSFGGGSFGSSSGAVA